MNIKEELNALITKANDWLSKVKAEKDGQKVALSDGKELSFSGEFAEGTEIKLGETPAEDGVYELADGRKLTVKDGKYMSIELKAVDPDPVKKISDELEAMKVSFAAQAEELKTVKENFTSVLEGNKVLLAAVESVASHLEKEPAAPVGGNEGEGMTKSDFIVAQAKQRRGE